MKKKIKNPKHRTHEYIDFCSLSTRPLTAVFPHSMNCYLYIGCRLHCSVGARKTTIRRPTRIERKIDVKTGIARGGQKKI